MKMGILSIPIELLEQILDNCSKDSLLRLRLVSKSLRRLCTPFAFRSVSLTEPWHTRSSKQVKSILESGATLASYIRSVSVDKRVLTWPQTRRGMQGELNTITLTLTSDFRRLFDACGANVQELTLHASSDGYRMSRTGEELMIQVGAAISSTEMRSLRKLRLFVETACDLNYLLGREIHDHHDDEEEDSEVDSSQSRTGRVVHPFLGLQELEVYFNGMLGHQSGSCDLAPAVNKFTKDLDGLRKLHVEAAYRMSFPTPAAFFPPHKPIFDFSSVGGTGSPSQLTSLHLRGYVYILNTSPILPFLDSLPNLQCLGLSYFTISEMGYRGDPTWPPPTTNSDATGTPNWRDVFDKVLGVMRGLVRYEFTKLVNLVEQTDAGPKNRQGEDRSGWDGMTKEEDDALGKLKSEVARRRKNLRMSEYW